MENTQVVLATLAHNSFGYRILLLVHILTAIVGFGSSFVWPMLAARARRLGSPAGDELARAGAELSRPLTVYMVLAVLVTGLAVAGVGAGWRFSQPWVWISFVLTTVMALVATFLQTPNLDAMVALRPNGDAEELEQRRKRDAMYGGIGHTLFLVVLVLMIWKPGA